MPSSTGQSQLAKYEWTIRACYASVALLILGGSLGLIARPLIAKTVTLRQQVHETRVFLSDRQKIQVKNDALLRRFQEFDQRREEITARIPDHPNESVFLAQITQAAKNCGLTVKEFRPGSTKRNERFSEMEIGVSSQGNYVSLCRFLDLVDDLPRYALLSNIDLDASSGSQSFPIQMQLRIFFNEGDARVSWVPESMRGAQ